MVWFPGESGNSNGRPPDARRPRTQAALSVMDERGDRDSLEIASEIANNENHPIEARAPYIKLVVDHTHSKPAATPPLRYINQPFEIDTFETEEQAEKFLAHVLMLVARGQQDIQSALDLHTLTRNWINSKRDREELQIKAVNSGASDGEQVIRIEGGMPRAPGHEGIIMPKFNGHEIELEATPAISAPEQPRVDDQAEAQPKGSL
jgi:hypothetical protein